MDAREKKMMDALAASAEDVEVPESLSPEAMLHRLRVAETAEAARGTMVSGEGAWEPSGREGAPRKPRRLRWIPAAAACIVLLCGVGLWAALGTDVGCISEVARDRAGGHVVSGDAQSPDASEAAGEAASEGGEVIPVPTAESYDQLYRLLSATGAGMDGLYAEEAVDIAMETEAAPAAGTADGAVGSADRGAQSMGEAKSMTMLSDESGDFSQTNLRTEGVDEADIVKTDGRCIYTLQRYGARLSIVQADGGDMAQLAVIEDERLGDYCEFYLDGGKLYLIANEYEDNGVGGVNTKVMTYDVADPASPRKVAEVQQAGYYHSSRFVDGFLYLFTDFHPVAGPGMDAPDYYVPTAGGAVLKCDDVYVPSCASPSAYLVIGSIRADDPGTVLDTKAVLTGAGGVYVSTDSIYTYGTKYEATTGVALGARGEAPEEEGIEDIAAVAADEEATTQEDAPAAAQEEEVAMIDVLPARRDVSTAVCKLSYGDGIVRAVGETTVPGVIDSGFSIDEYEGNTRIVTTSYAGDGSTSNNVFVLDGGLREIGSLTGLAPGERVYSARLMGPIGYFVTYRETDPLFSVDLSDPREPKVIGQLKIPGFSEYLHPWGAGRLLGLGMATSGDGTVTDGIKLSMFDVSDPTDVREETTYVLKGDYWSPAFEDYRAAFVDVERGLFGFAADGEESSYYLFRYDAQAGFADVLTDESRSWNYMGARGVRIANVFYVVRDGRIAAYDMDGFTEIGTVSL